MVRVTEYEQRMLDGEMGEFKQKAIQKIVDYANVLGAKELCEVSKATVYLGAHEYLEAVDSEDYNEIFSKMLLCSEKTIPLDDFSETCFSQTCGAACDHDVYEPINLSKEVFDKNREYLEKTCEVGVSIAGSCTPYLSGWLPLRGEHFVSTESSNILMSNSYFGAYGNADGLEASAWSAICGRTPKWGNHLPENRFGTHVFDIQCKSDTVIDWDIIGLAIGSMLPGNAKPVISGDFKRPDLDKLKRCFGSMATTSGAEICHIVGCTAEAPTLEVALGGKAPIETIVLTQEIYDRTFSTVCDEGSENIQMVMLGCPHYSLAEIKHVAHLLKGKKVHPDVSLQIWTDMTMQKLAEVNGYAETIRKAGAHLLNSACPLVCGRTVFDKISTGFATDGAKQSHYLHTDLDHIKIFYGDAKRCVEAAVKGRWEAENE